MKKYPIALDLEQRRVLIVGGGQIALRKIKGLQKTGAVITVVAPTILPEIGPLVQYQRQRPFEFKDLLEQELIFCCTDAPTLNRRIAAAVGQDQLVNNTSDKQTSNFYNFATITYDEVTINIGSDGQNIHKVQRVKQAIQRYLAKL